METYTDRRLPLDLKVVKPFLNNMNMFRYQNLCPGSYLRKRNALTEHSPKKTSERVREHSIVTLKFIPEQFISCRLLVDVNRYECGLEHQSNANDVSVQSSFNSYSHEEAHQKGKMCKNSIPATWRKQGLL